MFSEHGSDNPKREYIIIIKADLIILLKEETINIFLLWPLVSYY